MIAHATQSKPTNIFAYILLSPTPEATSKKQHIAFNAPLLNIRGGKETREEYPGERSSWIKAIEASGGESMELATADQYFSEQEENLVLFTSDWLR